MELDNKKLTIIIIILSIIVLLNMCFSIVTYLQLRNKSGPVGPRGPRGARGASKA